jgi:hypothetical protein
MSREGSHRLAVNLEHPHHAALNLHASTIDVSAAWFVEHRLDDLVALVGREIEEVDHQTGREPRFRVDPGCPLDLEKTV